MKTLVYIRATLVKAVNADPEDAEAQAEADINAGNLEGYDMTADAKFVSAEIVEEP